MPCWSVLETEIGLDKVDRRLLMAAGAAERWRVDVSGQYVILQSGDTSIVCDASGGRIIARGESVTWGGKSYAVQTPDGKRDLVNAIRRSVAVQAVAQAARAKGAIVQAAGGGRARVILRGI